MSIDPSTPVLIGAAAASQRFDDPSEAVEAAALMTEATRRAIRDAGIEPDVVAPHVDWVVAMNSMTSYRDPAALVAAELGATNARSVLADIGVLQTTPFGRAAQAIAEGDIDLAIVTGAETKFRSLRSQITGIEVTDTVQPDGTAPDLHWSPTGDIISPVEISAGLITAVQQYAMLENAARAHAGRSIEAQQRQVAELYARFNAVARDNPDAWYPEPKSVDFLATPSKANRPLAFPYLKWHNSQWNVDQAAAFVLCSVVTAQELGVDPATWIFPVVVVESNHMVPVGARRDLHRSVGFDVLAETLVEVLGRPIDQIDLFELYSCFPVAVQAQIDAFGLAQDCAPTLTGGMPFAGGPLNNFVLQALVEMVKQLRARPGAVGLSTAVSGMLTKQGASVWSSGEPARPFALLDRSEAAAKEPTVHLDARDSGPGEVATYTVRYSADGDPIEVVLLVDAPDGGRFISVVANPDFAQLAVRQELIGSEVEVESGGSVTHENRTWASLPAPFGNVG